MSETERTLAIIGMRGAGKSAVARLLAERLGRPVVSLDSAFEREVGQTIKEFIESGHPWEAFRDAETRLLERYLDGEPRVVDCGGGIVEREPNRALLQERARVIWVDASLETLAGRIGHGRPSVTGRPVEEELAELRERREALYAACAKVRVQNDGRSPEETVAEIMRELGFD